MTKSYFVVEGNNDESILRKLLPNNLFLNTRVIVAGGYSAALSGIQTLFTRTHCPIYFFFDSDEPHYDEIETKESFIKSYLKPLSNELYLFPLKPEIESLFFYKKDLLEKIINHPISDELWQKGQSHPKKVLLELTDGYLSTLLYKLTPEIIAQLQENPALQEIIEKLSSFGTNDHYCLEKLCPINPI